ncbi:heparan-alpha-glucosaminide N-acetyltransferase-like [Homalodisca vitripennis]|uniref:heparan-alpha-glucosaminide N-acetyltransferase-like n=1 Tax=Homalodisca vitripennis TaxID=197043 RepID=UPI001EEB1AA6|nr:heparan-alpha-glucosaminide N-acetyltransferase-like [Homalodisca vitripennis]
MNTEFMTQELDIFCSTTARLYYDEACLQVENPLNVTLTLLRQTALCHKCQLKFWTNINPMGTLHLVVTVNAPTIISYRDISRSDQSCVITYQFGPQGLYRYVLDFSCDYVHVSRQPETIFFDLLVFLVLCLIVCFAYFTLRHFEVFLRAQHWMEKRLYAEKSMVPSADVELKDNQTPSFTQAVSEVEIFRKTVFDEETNTEKTMEFSSRGVNTSPSIQEVEDVEPKSLEFVEFEALLVFRGLVVSLWIFFNVEAQTVPLLQKSPWDGLKMYDLRIGWFYWALAASFYLHYHLSLSRGESRKRVFLRGVLLRSAIYCVAGLCYNHTNNTSIKGQDFQPQFPPINKLRIFGILQRVGLAQLVTSGVEVCVMSRTIKRGPLRDLKESWLQWLVCVVLVTLHTSITYLLPFPDCPTGYTGPGGFHDNASAVDCTGGVSQYIDRAIVGKDRLLPVRVLEQAYPVYDIPRRFDPDGLLGTLTTCFLLALAMQASRIFILFHRHLDRIMRLVCWASLQLLVGGVLCGFQQYDGPIPINRYLMSVSYVLVASGLAYLVLLVLYLLTSVWSIWSGFPFIYSGINILVVFYGSLVFHHTFPFVWQIPPENSDTSREYLVVAGWNLCVWHFVCYQLLKHAIVCPV